tara:strand:+ start:628 stop:864 length:237 start_codon:yes stop_codon:yes gene_type:complete
MNLIRKIIVGPNPKDAMAYYIGMKAGTSKVCAIKEDDAALHRFSIRRYHVYLEGDNETYIWKTIESQPVLIEYDCHFE